MHRHIVAALALLFSTAAFSGAQEDQPGQVGRQCEIETAEEQPVHVWRNLVK